MSSITVPSLTADHLLIRQGRTCRFTVRFRDRLTRAPIPVVGATLVLTLRRKITDATPLAVFSLDTGEFVWLDVPTAVAKFELTPSVSVGLAAPDAGVADAVIVFADGTERCWWKGTFAVELQVTRE